MLQQREIIQVFLTKKSELRSIENFQRQISYNLPNKAISERWSNCLKNLGEKLDMMFNMGLNSKEKKYKNNWSS